MQILSLQQTILSVAEAQSLDSVLQSIVGGLADHSDIALARIWLMETGDLCSGCHLRNVCPDQTRCLHLVASAGNAKAVDDGTHSGGQSWTGINGYFRRIPLNAPMKVGYVGGTGKPVLIQMHENSEKPRWIAHPEWIAEQQIQTFAGQPLTFKGEILGVLGVFSRARLLDEECNSLRFFADHAAIAIANARALEGRLRAEKALELQVKVLQNMPAVAWTVTPDGKLDFINNFFLEATGRSLEDCVSPPEVWNQSGNGLPPFLGGVRPDHQARAAEIFWNGVRSGQGWTFEAPYFHANDNSYHWHLDTAVPLQDSDGKVVRFIGSCVDVEELKRAVGKNQTLLEISNAIATNLSQDKLMRAVSEALHHIVEFDHAVLALYVPEKDVFRMLEVDSRLRSDHFRPGQELDRKANSVGWVFQHQKSLVRGNLLQEQEYSNEHILAAEGVKSQIVVPLIVRAQCIGALSIASRTANLYTQADADFLREVANQVSLAVENMKSYEEISALKMQLEKENIYLREEISTEHNFGEIVGSSPVLLELLRKVELVAPTDSSVLISGETGTGKELIARAIHARSLRKGRPLVKVNCGSIPAGLVESELFGHVKGAFTGATANRVGRFELADGGTLFLDEVGELPLDTQVKLLRVLQEQEFEPVGSSRTIRVNLRIVAATNRDLEQAVKAGSFRSDLYYRLNVLPLHIPALRERRDDIAQIVLFFLDRYGKRGGKRIESISKETMELLVNYAWPGNIRELQNVIERGVVLCQGSVLTLGPDFLPAQKSIVAGFRTVEVSSAISQSLAGQIVAPPSANVAASFVSAPASLEEVERRHILRVLGQTKGLISGPNGAATILKLNANTLRSRMKKLGIALSRHDIS